MVWDGTTPNNNKQTELRRTSVRILELFFSEGETGGFGSHCTTVALHSNACVYLNILDVVVVLLNAPQK